MDLLELTRPNDPRKMCGIAQRKATEWSVFDAGSRTAATERLTVNNAQKKITCKFYAKGSCKHGKECKFDHGSGSKGSQHSTGSGKGGGKGQGEVLRQEAVSELLRDRRSTDLGKITFEGVGVGEHRDVIKQARDEVFVRRG